MNYFPNNDEEIALIKFIAKYQYLPVNDAKYFFKSKKYYRARITSLVQKSYLRRTKLTYVLDELGIEYCKLSGFEYTPLNRNQKYFPRLLYISSLAAFYNTSKNITFTPSYSIKDKEMFTVTARKFIGIFNINGIEYLTYSITKERDNKYIKSVIYDIQKEDKYRNIIVFVDDKSRINIDDFTFGYNQVLIIEDNEINKEMLKTLNNVDWSKVIYDIYKNNVYIAEYKFCDYTDYKHKYITYFYFLDSEKINRVNYFLRENRHKSADIICTKELKEELDPLLPKVNYIIIDLEDYIERNKNIYD